MFRIELDFPNSGWSNLRITQEDRRIKMSISYLTDGVGDLIRAFHRYIVHRETVVAELEGEGLRSLVVIHTSGICSIDPVEICVLPNLYDSCPDRKTLRPSACEAYVFVAKYDEFCKEVIRSINTMLNGHNLMEYYQSWACPPQEEAINDPKDQDAHMRWVSMHFPVKEYAEMCRVVENMK